MCSSGSALLPGRWDACGTCGCRSPSQDTICEMRLTRSTWRLSAFIGNRFPRKGIAHVQRYELAKVAIVRIQRSDPMLEKDGSEVRVGHQVSAHDQLARHLFVRVHKAFQLRHCPDVRQREQRADV